MTSETAFNSLKSIIKKTIRYGDFLIDTNRFSDRWIYTGSWNTEEARQSMQTILTGFWTTFLHEHPEKHVLVTLEYLENYVEHEFPTGKIAQDVVEKLDHPRLCWKKLVVDPDSFELYMEQWPTGCALIIFVEVSVRLDLLRAVYNNLHALGCYVAAILAIVEYDEYSATEIRTTMDTELIPLLMYDEHQNHLYSILELQQEPHCRYHSYFT
ncbi:hypothetical protein U27_05485 [Candidatus Vecturithrix granuli]|uniref:Uncharacterized protein n=1 Tax=Vecturithrix granuli TaxID=1499967 RepID=A0A081C1Q6_VECG1|nr:hypothetical protein U27_05485 [Candidatus Vecturithrix granuli]